VIVSDELLPYYNQELAAVRHLGGEFARLHPKIAARLRLNAEGSTDPHVERLVQAFAFLNARIRHKLDDDFPEISDALLSVLYPHYQRPIPSMCVVQFALDRTQGELTTGYRIPRGTAVSTEPDPQEGEPCRFRTCYPATLWPFQTTDAKLARPPFPSPGTPHSADAQSILKLEFQSFAPSVGFGQFDLGSLRFYLQTAQPQNAYLLYELLLNHTLEIAVARSVDDPQRILLPANSWQPVGFARDEGMFPNTARSFLGYRLLTEFFTFPQKFLFLDLQGLSKARLAKFGNKLEIYCYLNRSIPALEQTLNKDTLRLGCAPIVNLFNLRTEPIQLTETDTEYRVVPDARREMALEIYSLDRVVGTSPDQEKAEYQPFYSFKHGVDRNTQQTFWHVVRRPRGASLEGIETDPGTEMYLSLVDLGFTPAAIPRWTIDIEATCLNRSLPSRLPFGGGRPHLDLPEGRGPVSKVECLTPPTPTLRPPLKNRALWRLISHLSLNHLSLSDLTEGADALREILKLYDFTDSQETRSLIEGLMRVSSRRVVGRAGGLAGGFCRGMEVAIHFDEKKYTGSGAYLFACVLDRFLGMYASLNSFTKLVATSEQRRGLTWQWPPRTGERVLL